MNLKTTYILFGILVAALAGLALTQLFGLGKQGPKSEFIFPDLHAKKATVEEKDIDTIRIEHADSAKTGTYAFARDDAKNWEMEEPQKVRVDRFAVNNLVNDLIGAKKEKVETVRDLKEYELDKPHAIVTFTRGDQAWTLNVGKESQGSDPYVFVTTSSRPKEPVAVRKSSLQSVFKSLNDFRSRTLLAASESDVEKVELRAAGKKQPVSLAKESAGRWRFTEPAGFGAADYDGASAPQLSTEKGTKITGVRDLLRDTVDLRIENTSDFVADNVSEQDLKDKYGLDKEIPATLRIIVTSSKKTAEGDKTTTTETVLIGKKIAAEKPEKKDEKKDEKKEEKKEEKKP